MTSKKTMFKRLMPVILSIFMLQTLIPISTNGNYFDLLGYYDEDSLLGTATLFSVFVENDFSGNGSDCEGRLAVGGGANLSDTWNCYSWKRTYSKF